MPTIRAAVSADPTVAEDWRAYHGQARYEGWRRTWPAWSNPARLARGLDLSRATDIMWTVLASRPTSLW